MLSLRAFIEAIMGANTLRHILTVSIASYTIDAWLSSFELHTRSAPSGPTMNSAFMIAEHSSDFPFFRASSKTARLKRFTIVSGILNEYSASMNAFCHSISCIGFP